MLKVLCKDIINIIISVLVISGALGLSIYHSKSHCSTSPEKSIECDYSLCEPAVSITYETSNNSKVSVTCSWSGYMIYASFHSLLAAGMLLILFVFALYEKECTDKKVLFFIVGTPGLLANIVVVILMCAYIKESFKYTYYYANKFTLHHASYIIHAVLMFILLWVSFWNVYVTGDVNYWNRDRVEGRRGKNIIKAIIARFTRSRPQPQPQPQEQAQSQSQQQIVIQAENPQGGTEQSEDNSNMELNANGVDEEEFEE